MMVATLSDIPSRQHDGEVVNDSNDSNDSNASNASSSSKGRSKNHNNRVSNNGENATGTVMATTTTTTTTTTKTEREREATRKKPPRFLTSSSTIYESDKSDTMGLGNTSSRYESICSSPNNNNDQDNDEDVDDDSFDLFDEIGSETGHGDENDDNYDYGSNDTPNDAYGLMITKGCDEQLQLALNRDCNFWDIHPHVYAPKNLRNVRLLGGGGSGVSVFAGEHPKLGNLVMKHGGYKDLGELFALATIAEELKRRGEITGNEQASINMQRRLPDFKMIYISPYHVMAREQEVYNHVTGLMRSWSFFNDLDNSTALQGSNHTLNSSILNSPTCRRRLGFRFSQPKKVGLSIRLFEGDSDAFTCQLDTDSRPQSLELILPKGQTDIQDATTISVRGDAYQSLHGIVTELLPMMNEKLFKFTLAQKTIGGKEPKTGNQWLYEGGLKGDVLDNLITQFIQVIRHLQSLTLPEEIDVVQMIRDEVTLFEEDPRQLRASDISPIADAFVGHCVIKNFHPVKGRGLFLRTIGEKFRHGSLVLTDEEIIPAKHLGNLLKNGALMSETFANAPMEPTVIQMQTHFWRNILHRAVEDRSDISPTALNRIWTCGLTDAGIHNLFVSETDLYLFDLGEPQLQSVPGFLTKFLFSFFHTLGMEEGEEDNTWVRRFDVRESKLCLTDETMELLPASYDAFEICLNRIVDEVLDGDTHIRWLLLQYVTMQLLSDAAFCLQRWEIKGGGVIRDHNHQKSLEKWLWRAIWDIYVAFDINTQTSWSRFDVVHPHHRQ